MRLTGRADSPGGVGLAHLFGKVSNRTLLRAGEDVGPIQTLDRGLMHRLLPLSVLDLRLREARQAVEERRDGASGTADVLFARQALLLAMEDYVSALDRHGLPVPYLLRDELRLHAQIADDPRNPAHRR